MDVGIAVPTCVEGMAYPIRFADHEGILRITQEAERLGYASVLVNDHLSTMPYVREQYDDPPRFYEPMVTLTYLASNTSTIRLMTGVVVVPMRDPVLLAKQAACVDQISGGRLTLGVGVGAYRAEFESVRPDISSAPRGALVAEGIEALQALFGQRRASYDGTYFRFNDVEMYPKPVQDPFPIVSCGNAEGTIKRAAASCAGWMPAGMPLERLASGVQRLRGYAEAAGRDPASLSVMPQLVMCIDDDQDAANERFTQSQAYEHLVSLSNSTLKGIAFDAFTTQNLIGSPAEIVARIEAMRAVGATSLAGMIVVANTEAELIEQMQRFATTVLPALDPVPA